MARYGPPGIVIDEKLEILQSRGHTSPFIEMPQGAVSLQLTRMLRKSLSSQVTKAVDNAVEQDVPVRLEGLRVTDDDQERQVTLEVLPIHTMAPRSKCFLVLFAAPQQAPITDGHERDGAAIIGEAIDRDHLVERLRQDLASTKLYLQTLIEERDAKNQELVSANEEIQSANEEMQSTNDLSNLLNRVNLPVLMLGTEFHIRHFTPATQRLMNLRAPGVGRPFSEIRLNLNIDDLEPLFHEVLGTLTPREMEVQDHKGRCYLLRVRPYRTTDNKIDGLVVVLLDVDQLRRSQQELRGTRDFARSIIESVPLPLAVVGLDFRIRSVNDAFRNLSGSGKEDLDRRSLPDLASAVWGLDEPLRTHLEALRVSSISPATLNSNIAPRARMPGNSNPRARPQTRWRKVPADHAGGGHGGEKRRACPQSRTRTPRP